MTLKRVGRAFAVSVVCFLVSFVLTNVIMILWYDHAYPHDGQSGIAAFVCGLMVAPVCAIIAFIACLLRR